MAYNGMVRAFFRDCTIGLHDLLNHELRIALYEDRSVLTPDVEFYDPTGEVAGQNYPPGGLQIFVAEGWPTITDEYAMECRFEPVRFSNLTAIVGGALIYNETSNRAIACIDFGEKLYPVAADFNIEFPETSIPTIFVKLPVR